MPSIFYSYVDSPVGDFLVAGTDQALCMTSFTTGHRQRRPKIDWIADDAPLSFALPHFYAYFAGEVVTFDDVPMKPEGTEFQRQVWHALTTIQYGKTASYGDIARLLNSPGASQAIGAANGANHLPIIIPCHRIIGADGSLTGFGGGLETKKKLLKLEGHHQFAQQLDLL